MAVRVKALPHQPPARATLMGGEPAPNVASVPAEVLGRTEGPVSFLQKVAKYYKAIIAFLGTVLTLLTAPQIGPLQHLLPPTYQHWLTIGIGALTVLLTFLKENEHWLPDAAVPNVVPR